MDTLDARGLPATFINSTLSGSEMAARLNAAERGEYKLLYVAQERFDAESFQERTRRSLWDSPSENASSWRCACNVRSRPCAM